MGRPGPSRFGHFPPPPPHLISSIVSPILAIESTLFDIYVSGSSPTQGSTKSYLFSPPTTMVVVLYGDIYVNLVAMDEVIVYVKLVLY